MLYNTEAIVIRTIPYGETGAIVTLLTPQGTVAAMARGAKKPQSRLSGGVQLCVHGIYTLSQGRGMGTISQFEVIDAHRKLHQELDLAAYAAYFCELVRAAAEERPNGQESLFRSFKECLNRLLSGREIPSVIARIWESKVLLYLGASPDWTSCVQCGSELVPLAWYYPHLGGFTCSTCHASLVAEHRGGFPIQTPSAIPKILSQFSRTPWERMGDVRLQPQTQKLLEQILRHQLADYGGVSLKSRSFVERINELWRPES